ncbi:MAG: radical SAM family heme chaperone HemW [Bdellovibrionales bacterium]|nr:radical SAM family heme chaperone HemW [Bdellovibrionales bacterium]
MERHAGKQPGIRSIYLHFPFCETKCHYCDFYSIGRERTKEEDPLVFEQALRAELALLAKSPSIQIAPELDTIFMGGGTPSMTPPESMTRALEPLWEVTRLSAKAEWTMEANPSSVSLERLRQYRSLGVNRISMGVQALRDDLLLRLGRVHSRDRALESLDAIFEAGFDNVSVDLLCGVPQQSLQDLEAALDQLTRFPITHLSCYLLTLPKTHRMYRELPHENEQLEHLLLIDRWMTAQGFEHYEISNFAKPGKQARHNLVYWQREGYLSAGPSAHSFDPSIGPAGRRWKNVSSLHKYSQMLQKGELPIEWTEELKLEDQELERWMLALRLSEGFPTEWLQDEPRRLKAQVLQEQGLLEIHPQKLGTLRLTPRGFALSDQVISSLA